VAKDVFIGPGVRILNVMRPTVSNPNPKVDAVSIGEGAVIGGGSVILPGVTIGPRAFVAAGAIVSKDLPAGTIAKGQAAQIMLEK
jgi:maltose O-acetyltransferase